MCAARRSGHDGDEVPHEELAEIARHLRGVLDHPSADASGTAPPPRRDGGNRRIGSGAVVLRFLGGFILPGLILVVIALVGGIDK